MTLTPKSFCSCTYKKHNRTDSMWSGLVLLLRTLHMILFNSNWSSWCTASRVPASPVGLSMFRYACRQPALYVRMSLTPQRGTPHLDGLSIYTGATRYNRCPIRWSKKSTPRVFTTPHGAYRNTVAWSPSPWGAPTPISSLRLVVICDTSSALICIYCSCFCTIHIIRVWCFCLRGAGDDRWCILKFSVFHPQEITA